MVVLQTMGATLSFALSLVALTSFLLLKRVEYRRGRIFFPNVRAKLDAFIVETILHLHRSTVEKGAYHGRTLLVRGLHTLSLFMLFIIRTIESRLLTFIHFVKGKHEVKRTTSGVASPFLRNVLEHKRSGRKNGSRSRTTLPKSPEIS